MFNFHVLFCFYAKLLNVGYQTINKDKLQNTFAQHILVLYVYIYYFLAMVKSGNSPQSDFYCASVV